MDGMAVGPQLHRKSFETWIFCNASKLQGKLLNSSRGVPTLFFLL